MDTDMHSQNEISTKLTTNATGKATFIAVIINIIVAVANIWFVTRSEYDQRYWEARMNTYIELTTTTGKLTSYYRDPIEMRKLKADFLGIYYGKIDIFRDNSVGNAVEKYKNVLDLFSPEGSQTCNLGYLNQLRAASSDLAKCCDKSLNNK